LFLPLHYHFIKTTIHAGETGASKNIWEALFLLHAKRIGHGLELHKNQEMMDYLRDFHISLEMCPTSNSKVRFYTLYPDEEQNLNQCKELYPLRTYLQHGISVSINTDNRGISMTSMSQEFLKAAQLSENGLSKWEVLQLIKNGVESSFLSSDEKKQLTQEFQKEIIELIIEEYL